MPNYKVCVYAISKNEGKFVERWMESMKEADLVVVTDTGSDDDTVEKLVNLGAVVYEEKIKPWRFDVARNVSLSHVPDDIDIAVCTDLDEIFRVGWREELEKAWTPDTKTGNYMFNWSLKKDGTPQTQFVYFKAHSPKDYIWLCPVHEYLKYTGTDIEKKVFVDKMILDHYPDIKKSRDQYLELLEMAVKEEPGNERMVYYLGREYMYCGKWEDCICTLKKYLEMETSTWKEERCGAMRWIAKSYGEKEEKNNAYKWFFNAIAEVPYMREPYIELARYADKLKDWETAYFGALEALKIKEKSQTYVNMGYCWDYTPNDLASISSFWLGSYKLSLEHGRKALEFEPDNVRLQENYKIIEEKLMKKV